jgi:hypothetical protein
MLGNFLAVRDSVFDVEPNGVSNVFDSLFVSVSLAVTALEHGAGNEITVGVGFNDDGKREVFHVRIINPVGNAAKLELKSAVGPAPRPDFKPPGI